eukprot:GHVP01016102.1.p1 GENE.GHVP01016102.1~~GHVP01016102.1.p1  ORF type:complete len:159 (+),score=28.98 GHVP01016102.1:181-657(+)
MIAIQGTFSDPCIMNTPEVKRKRVFRKFMFKGIQEEDLVRMPREEILKLLGTRARRRFRRGIPKIEHDFYAEVKKSLDEKIEGEKPEVVMTRLRTTIILPEMFGSIVGVYNGKDYVKVEIKPEMIGNPIGEYSLTYKKVSHGRPGVGATSSSKYVPLK